MAALRDGRKRDWGVTDGGGWPLSASSCYAHLARSKVRAALALLRGHVLRGLCVFALKPVLRDLSLHFLPGYHDESEEIDSRNKETVVGGANSLSKLRDAPYIR